MTYKRSKHVAKLNLKTGIPTCILRANLCKTCILKLGPDDDLEDVETCRQTKLNNWDANLHFMS